jgi:hypothetical protein
VILLASLAVAILLQSQLIEATRDRVWAEFSRTPAFSGPSLSVRIGTLRTQGGVIHYWLEKTERFGRNKLLTTSHTSSRICPQVRELIGSLRSLDLPRPAPPASTMNSKSWLTASRAR